MKVLLFNIENKKSIEIKNLCRKLNIEYTDVDKSDFGYKIEYILNLSDDKSFIENSDFDGEMLLMVDLSEGILDLFLSLLRKKKCTVALKAVLTETNRKFTSYELYSEISKEHEYMQKGERFHQA
ncbi:MAG: DUF3783 domain-containing protein [Ruminococcus sp.]|jgi:hypothetical protein|nr:DUF3783 domain-containing protein [Ruminococcus sp.]